MRKVEHAEAAIKHLNGYNLHGRVIRVDFSATQKPHNPTPGQYMGEKKPLSTRRRVVVCRHRTNGQATTMILTDLHTNEGTGLTGTTTGTGMTRAGGPIVTTDTTTVESELAEGVTASELMLVTSVPEGTMTTRTEAAAGGTTNAAGHPGVRPGEHPRLKQECPDAYPSPRRDRYQSPDGRAIGTRY